MEAAVHHTVVVVHMAGLATAAHSVGVVVVVLVVVCADHTLVIGINHMLESFLKVIFTNYQSTIVALYRFSTEFIPGMFAGGPPHCCDWILL